MTEMFVLAVIWLAVLGYIGFVSKEAMQMTWLIGLGLLAFGSVLVVFFPGLR